MVIEKSLVLAKADVLERGILHKVIQRIEEAGLKIVAAKLVQANKSMARKHYPGTHEWKERIGGKILECFDEADIDVVKKLGTDDPKELGQKIHNWSVDYLMKNPVLAMIVEGPHAVERMEQMTGHTEPRKADRGTIRGDFCLDSIIHSNLESRAIYNLVHTSKTPKDAKREIKVWFKSKELLKYKTKYDEVHKK